MLDGHACITGMNPRPKLNRFHNCCQAQFTLKDRPDASPVNKHAMSYLVPGVERIPPRFENGDGHASADHA